MKIKNRSSQASESTPPIGGDYSKNASKDIILNSEKMSRKTFCFLKKVMPNILSLQRTLNRAINHLVSKTNDDAYRGKYTGGKHLFSGNAAKHTLAEHGDFLREALRAQLPMTPDDIARHLSAVKDDKKPSDVFPSRTNSGEASILTAYEVNGYTLYAEEITKITWTKYSK